MSARLDAIGIARHVLEASASGGSIDPGAAPAMTWASALEGLMQAGQQDAVRHVLPALRQHFQSRYFRNLDIRLRQDPEHDVGPIILEEAAARMRESEATEQPLRVDGIRPAVWAAAMERQLGKARLSVLADNVAVLRSAFPTVAYFSSLDALLQRIAAVDRRELEIRSDFVKVGRAGEADTVLFVFTVTPAMRCGVPRQILNRLLSRLPVHIVYLAEPKPAFFMRGVPGLGPDYPTVLQGLKDLASELGASRILTLGASRSGYPALRFALDLGAEASLVFGAMTHLSDRTRILAQNYAAEHEMAVDPEELAGIDLKPRLAEAAQAPRMTLVYGAADSINRDEALRLEEMTNVTCEALPGGHNALLTAVLTDRFDPLLDDLVRGSSQAKTTAGQSPAP
ncbi:hypothetical protein ASG17_11325 [Brevundimonas sp. Leaf363]|uniref:hypothetical protein n=1 Tax=Brevundimonas sp. Leaf363 TaxID=1736353 RepID=UPI0006FA07FC|nr:hypothetical protein [Brevundimonas sp. Leaf363]KQS54236.1 hypothetical protein ASG17_11325 [Brevundimonas sp. Leaf363]